MLTPKSSPECTLAGAVHGPYPYYPKDDSPSPCLTVYYVLYYTVYMLNISYILETHTLFAPTVGRWCWQI